ASGSFSHTPGSAMRCTVEHRPDGASGPAAVVVVAVPAAADGVSPRSAAVGVPSFAVAAEPDDAGLPALAAGDEGLLAWPSKGRPVVAPRAFQLRRAARMRGTSRVGRSSPAPRADAVAPMRASEHPGRSRFAVVVVRTAGAPSRLRVAQRRGAA